MRKSRSVRALVQGLHAGFLLALLSFGLWASCSSGHGDSSTVASTAAPGYEVWVSDQANTQGITGGTPNGTHGGHVLVYDSADLERTPPVNNPQVLDVEVFSLAPPWNNLAGQYEGSYSLITSGVCGTTLGASRSNDPTPDLGDLSLGGTPPGDRIFITLRGPFPLTVSHAADGSCPGLGIVTLSPDRRSGNLTAVFGTTVVSGDGTRNLSDPHAAIVRAKTS